MEICEKRKCVGCAACMNICPVTCIGMKKDEEGFLYPKIDMEKCIGCKKCMQACPICNTDKNMRIDGKKPLVYAAKNGNNEIRKESSSGGSFFLLAKSIIEMGGMVAGAAFNQEKHVRHILIEKKEDIPKLMGSKYMQSDCDDLYSKVELHLKQKRWVLFSGTPCQIAGLKTYLRTDYDTLLCVDIVCHGVPSPEVWDRYLDSLSIEKKNISNICFRNKSTGWKNYSVSVEDKNGNTVSEFAYLNTYMKGFLADMYLRQSCYDCSFKGLQSRADLTIGDFWGIHILAPAFDDDLGVSLLLVRSDKGRKSLDSIASNMILQEFSYEEAVKYNPYIVNSSDKWDNRRAFFENWKNEELGELITRVAERR